MKKYRPKEVFYGKLYFPKSIPWKIELFEVFSSFFFHNFRKKNCNYHRFSMKIWLYSLTGGFPIKEKKYEKMLFSKSFPWKIVIFGIFSMENCIRKLFYRATFTWITLLFRYFSRESGLAKLVGHEKLNLLATVTWKFIKLTLWQYLHGKPGYSVIFPWKTALLKNISVENCVIPIFFFFKENCEFSMEICAIQQHFHGQLCKSENFP